MKERAVKRLLAAFLAAMLVIGMVPANVQAAAAPKLSASKVTLYVGGKTTLKVKKLPKDAKVTWASNKKQVATVTKAGVVKAVEAGTAKVTATVKAKATASAKAKTYKLTCKVTVKSRSVTVKKQAALKNALNNAKLREITIQTDAAKNFTIPKGKYPKISLVVDAPNADVTNKGVFESIEIKSIKPETFTEYAKGNRFTVDAATARIVAAAGSKISGISVSAAASAVESSGVTIVVQENAGVTNIAAGMNSNVKVIIEKNAGVETVAAEAQSTVTVTAESNAAVETVKAGENSTVKVEAQANATVNTIEAGTQAKVEAVARKGAVIEVISVQGKGAEVTVEADGTVGKVDVKESATIKISGSAKGVPVTVAKEAADTKVTASVPVKIEASANVEVELAKGAEGSTVKTDSTDVKATVDNKTATKVTVTTPSGTQDVNAGQSAAVTVPVKPDPTPTNPNTPSGGGSSGGSSGGSTPVLKSITLDPTAMTLKAGESAVIKATKDPAGHTATVKWTSGDEKIATVDASGKVTAVAAGEVTITATADGKKATCKVTVEAKPEPTPETTITLDKTELTLTVGGETGTLKATVTPEGKAVTWSSSDESVATVKDGVVTAVSAGKATITATADGKKATCKVTVEAKPEPTPVTNIELDKTELTLTVGAEGTLTATVTPATVTGAAITWASNDPEVAAVNGNGNTAVVTGVKAGTATITVTAAAGGKNATATCTVTVEAGTTPDPTPETTITLDKTELTLTVGGETGTLKATVTPEGKAVTWSSSDETVATVKDGVVTAVSAGTATITAKASDGKEATCEVKVNEAPKSAACDVTEFKVGVVEAEIDESTKTITVTLTSRIADLPEVTIVTSEKANVSPESGTTLDLSNPTYTVTAEDGTTKTYTLKVVLDLDLVSETESIITAFSDTYYNKFNGNYLSEENGWIVWPNYGGTQEEAAKITDNTVYLNLGKVGLEAVKSIKISDTDLSKPRYSVSIGKSSYLGGKPAKLDEEGNLLVFLPAIVCEADADGKVTVEATDNSDKTVRFDVKLFESLSAKVSATTQKTDGESNSSASGNAYNAGYGSVQGATVTYKIVDNKCDISVIDKTNTVKTAMVGWYLKTDTDSYKADSLKPIFRKQSKDDAVSYGFMIGNSDNGGKGTLNREYLYEVYVPVTTQDTDYSFVVPGVGRVSVTVNVTVTGTFDCMDATKTLIDSFSITYYNQFSGEPGSRGIYTDSGSEWTFEQNKGNDADKAKISDSSVYLKLGQVGLSGEISSIKISGTALSDDVCKVSIGKDNHLKGKPAKLDKEGNLLVFLPAIVCEADADGKVTVEATDSSGKTVCFDVKLFESLSTEVSATIQKTGESNSSASGNAYNAGYGSVQGATVTYQIDNNQCNISVTGSTNDVQTTMVGWYLNAGGEQYNAESDKPIFRKQSKDNAVQGYGFMQGNSDNGGKGTMNQGYLYEVYVPVTTQGTDYSFVVPGVGRVTVTVTVNGTK